MWTRDKKKLRLKLGKVFLRRKKHEKPVDVKMAYSHGFLGYGRAVTGKSKGVT